MIEAGVLPEDERVELLEGWIVPKMPHHPPHDGTIDITEERLRGALPAGWRIRVQSAITTSDSEPEPDVAVVRGTARSFLTRHPGPADIGLLIEVSESTLQRDRTEKARLYARAQIGWYWLINLVDRQVEVHSDPTGPVAEPAFRQVRVYGIQDSVPFVLDGVEVASIPVSDILP